MNDKLLHTPEGVRDIYGYECREKLAIEQKMKETAHLYGFQDIQTPTFEYFDIFNAERGTVASKDMYKFFDREGNTLVLRPDMTPSIARCVAKYYKNVKNPIRLCYNGNTFINKSEFQGKLKEITQFGAELLNDGSVDADAEMLALTVECLQKANLSEFQVEVGEVEFFKGIVEEAGFSDDEILQLKELIVGKKHFGIADFLKNRKLSKENSEVILKFPDLFGSMEKLCEIRSLAGNARSASAIDRLLRLYNRMKDYGMEKYISFDLGMLSMYEYYTGIIFHGYTYGSGDTLLSGGRYDTLAGQFGKDAPAIGFGINIDQVLLALERQGRLNKVCTSPRLVIYDEANSSKAAAHLLRLRKDGQAAEFVKVENTATQESIRERAGGREASQVDVLVGESTS